MRESGIRGLLIYCSDYHCSHWIAIDGDRWPDDVRLLILSRTSSVRLVVIEAPPDFPAAKMGTG